MTHWYLFMLFITIAQPMEPPVAQPIRMYADSDRVTCDADGVALAIIMNNPLQRRDADQVIRHVCVNF